MSPKVWEKAGGEGGLLPPPETPTTPQHSQDDGLTLTQYAAAKGLSEDFLRELGVEQVSYFGAPVVQVQYYDASGAEGPVRYRFRLQKKPEGDGRFRWRKGSRPIPYGCWKLERFLEAGFIVLVEGESDCHCLWSHDVPGLGVPGSSNWRHEWSEYLDGFPVVYAVVEPDAGGESLRAALASSPLADRLRFVSLGEHKDTSACFLADRQTFRERFQGFLDAAVPAVDVAREEGEAKAALAWEQCEALAKEPNILERFVKAMHQLGAVGEDRASQLIYLALVSRLLDRPVSVVVKGPSAAGKSYTTENTLHFFPEGAYLSMSSMSEKALIYLDEPLANRMLVIGEATALANEQLEYLVRTLLSEGRLVHQTVEKDEHTGRQRTRRVETLGPTGCIITTTEISLHKENETRLLSVGVDDTRAQTARAMRALANGHDSEPDLSEWHALSDWLEGGEHRVDIPFAEDLAERIPPVAVRLRRDFGQLLNLIRAHALLHRATREIGERGIVATVADYAAVRELVADLIGEAVAATVSQRIRETVTAVARLIGDNGAPGRDVVTVRELAEALNLDKAAASRRSRAAAEAGHLRNLEDKKGKRARIVLGDPLPEEKDLLPKPEALRRCSESEEESAIPLPHTDDQLQDDDFLGGLF
jgi:hypothetical protein